MTENIRHFLSLLRIKHWMKNVFVFLPVFFAGKIGLVLSTNVAFVFLSFCLAASSIYILNDIIDVEEDRRHPKKQFRPIASCFFSKSTAIIILCVLVRHTYVAVNLWTWISIMNPHRLTYGFAGEFPFAAIAAVAALLSLLATKDPLKLPKDKPVILLILFLIWMCITTVAAYYPGESFEQLKKVLKIQLMTLIALAALRERKQVELFIFVNVISIGIYGLKAGVFTIMSGGNERVWGPPGTFIEGNNEIAVALIMAIPLMNYLRLVSSNKWI